MCESCSSIGMSLWSNLFCRPAAGHLQTEFVIVVLQKPQNQKGFKAFNCLSSLWLPYCFEGMKVNQTAGSLVFFSSAEYALDTTSLFPMHSDVVNNGRVEESTLSAQGWIPTSGGLGLTGGLNQSTLNTLAPAYCWVCFVVVIKCCQPARQHL